jgi:hypothetical protein
VYNIYLNLKICVQPVLWVVLKKYKMPYYTHKKSFVPNYQKLHELNTKKYNIHFRRNKLKNILLSLIHLCMQNKKTYFLKYEYSKNVSLEIV